MPLNEGISGVAPATPLLQARPAGNTTADLRGATCPTPREASQALHLATCPMPRDDPPPPPPRLSRLAVDDDDVDSREWMFLSESAVSLVTEQRRAPRQGGGGSRWLDNSADYSITTEYTHMSELWRGLL